MTSRALVRDRQREAGVRAPAVEQDRARAALPVVAALLGAGQVEVLAQQVEQRRPRVDRQAPLAPVDGERDLGHHGVHVHALPEEVARRSLRARGRPQRPVIHGAARIEQPGVWPLTQAASRSSAPACPAWSPRTCSPTTTTSRCSRPQDRARRPRLDVDVAAAGRRALGVDVGFLVFNDRNYPRFEALLAELGVAVAPSDMSLLGQRRARLRVRGHPASARCSPTAAHLADPRFLRMVAEYARFNRDARRLLASGRRPVAARTGCRSAATRELFVERLIVPQASAVWSADPQQLWSFPARFLVQFLDNHGMLGFRGRPRWRTIAGGSRTYVDAHRRAPGRPRCASARPVVAVARATPTASRSRRAGGAPERFDEVVLACHADQALALLADPTPLEPELLGAIPYLPSELVLHADASLLPRRRAAWASWNAHLLDAAPAAPTVTYHLNRLQGLDVDRAAAATLNLTDASTRRRSTPSSASRTPSSRPRRARAGPPRARSAASAARTSAARTGAGASTRTAWRARTASPTRSSARGRPGGGGGMTASALYDGRGPPPAARPSRPREFRHRDHARLPRPRRAPGAARRPPRPPPARARARAPARPARRRRTVRRWPTPCARSSRSARAARPRPARCACSPTPRTLGTCFNPVSFYYCFDRATSGSTPSSPR